MSTDDRPADSTAARAPSTEADAVRDTEDHFQVAVMEYVADCNGSGRWRIGADFYQVDEDVTDGPVELVRESDGLRLCVDVDVDVWVKPIAPRCGTCREPIRRGRGFERWSHDSAESHNHNAHPAREES